MEKEQSAEQAQAENKNSGGKDVQAQGEFKFCLEKTIPQQEKIMQDLINSMKCDILNKLDEIKTELSQEIKDIIKSQQHLRNEVQLLNPIERNSGGKDPLEGFYAGPVANLRPLVVEHVTSGVNAVKKNIPEKILDQYPEFAAALISSPGPISALFETYSFLRDMPDINPDEGAKSQILKVFKGLHQVAKSFDYQDLQTAVTGTNVVTPATLFGSLQSRGMF